MGRRASSGETSSTAPGGAVRRRLQLQQRHERATSSTVDELRELIATETATDAMIPYGRQIVDDDDIAAVVEVLRGDWLTQGPTIDRFEAAVADVHGRPHAVAFANGTAALHGAARRRRARPRRRSRHVAAVVRRLGQLCPLRRRRRRACRHRSGDTQPRSARGDPTGSMPSWPSTSPGFRSTSSRLAHRPRVVIEDAAHALGATTPDGPVGNCAHSDMTLLLVPPGQADHHRRRRRGHHQRRRARRAPAPVPQPRHRAAARARRLVLRGRPSWASTTG